MSDLMFRNVEEQTADLIDRNDISLEISNE